MVGEKSPDFQKRREKFLNNNYKTPLRQILSYLWDYKKIFTFILILGIIQSLIFLTFPLFLGPALDVLVNPSLPIENVFPIFLTIIIIQGIGGLLLGLQTYINRWVGANVIFNLRNDLFSTIQIMSWSWLDKNKTGDLISRTTSDVNLLKEFLQNNFQTFIRQIAVFFFSFVVLFLINTQLAFYVLIISPALFFILFLYRRKIRPVFKRSRETYSDLTHIIQENVQGITVVKSFGRESYEINKFTKKNDEYYEDSIGIIKLQATFDPVVFLLDNIAFLIVILLGGFLVLQANISFGDLFAFIMVLNFSVEPLYFISRFLGNMPQITETSKRVVDILNSEIDVKEKTNARVMPIIKGDIEFKNVFFSFDKENKNDILKDINFKVNAGENIAILGATGSGKSALVKLIPRFYDIREGEILIDGINIKEVKLSTLRRQIGFVAQERILFSKSMRDNIAFGKKDISLDEIKKAAEISDISEFIERELPKNYDTIVSEGGMTVSGGQKQRIAIARALAIKPRILILDDATSHLDVDTEFRIQAHFTEVFKNTTTFLITQRLSSVRNADRIIVLDKGRISQVGSHEELMSQNDGIYKKLYLTLKVEERA